MTSLADLHHVVQTTLAGERIGQPVFVRYLLQGVLDPQGPALAEIAGAVGDWMGQPPHRLSTLFSGKDGKGQTTLLLEFPGGQTALVSEMHGQARGQGLDLMVLGSKGALYHGHGVGGGYGSEPLAPTFDKRPAPEILAAIEEARKQSLQPVSVRKLESKPPTPPPAPAHQDKGKYGVLLVSGSHTHQENYLPGFVADPRCKLIAVTDEVDIDAKRKALNERLAQSLGIPYLPDLGEALKRKDVQIVSICAPPERRGRIAVRSAEAGKHLYLDKSLAPRQEEADAIAEAVRRAGVRSHMFSFITQPWARAARKLLQDGTLGELLAMHADVFFAKGRPGTAKLSSPRKEEYPPTRHQLVEAKRELDNIGVYPLTMVRWLTGKKFSTVRGVTANYFFQESQKHDVEDFGLLAGTLEGGLPVTISAGRIGWTSHPAGGVNRLILVGSERTAVIDANSPRLECYTDQTPWVPPNVNPADPLGFWISTQEEMHLQPRTTWRPVAPASPGDVAYFLDCLDAGRDSELSAAEAALTTEVLLAGYRSAASGAVVTLPLPRK